MSVVDTRSLVVDYVQYQLRKKELPWPGYTDLADDEMPLPSKVNETMRLLGQEFEERYTQVIIVQNLFSFTLLKKICRVIYILCRLSIHEFVLFYSVFANFVLIV